MASLRMGGAPPAKANKNAKNGATTGAGNHMAAVIRRIEGFYSAPRCRDSDDDDDEDDEPERENVDDDDDDDDDDDGRERVRGRGDRPERRGRGRRAAGAKGGEEGCEGQGQG